MRVRLSERTNAPGLGAMDFLNEITLRYPGAISFAPGRPPERFFRVEAALPAIARYIEHRARETGRPRDEVLASLGQYGKTNGLINDLLARHLAVDEGIDVPPEAVMVTHGAQEAMGVVLQGLFEPGRDVLLVSEPSYVGITGAAALLGVEVCPVPCGDDGLDPADVGRAIARVRAEGKVPKAVYDVPDFHNPLGTRMPLGARRRLLEVAREHGVLVLEDNPYAAFAYDGPRLPALKALDRHGVVAHLGTFSKTLFPGLRLGYLVADQDVAGDDGGPRRRLAQALSRVKSLTTVNTSPLAQAVVGGTLLGSGHSLAPLVAEKVAHARANRDAMLAALERGAAGAPELAGRLRWSRPAGGFFLTLTLPFACTEERALACARDFGVIVCPMSLFALLPGRERQARLSFSYVTPAQIDEGVARLLAFARATAAAEGAP